MAAFVQDKVHTGTGDSGLATTLGSSSASSSTLTSGRSSPTGEQRGVQTVAQAALAASSQNDGVAIDSSRVRSATVSEARPFSEGLNEGIESTLEKIVDEINSDSTVSISTDAHPEIMEIKFGKQQTKLSSHDNEKQRNEKLEQLSIKQQRFTTQVVSTDLNMPGITSLTSACTELHIKTHDEFKKYLEKRIEAKDDLIDIIGTEYKLQEVDYTFNFIKNPNGDIKRDRFAVECKMTYEGKRKETFTLKFTAALDQEGMLKIEGSEFTYPSPVQRPCATDRVIGAIFSKIISAVRKIFTKGLNTATSGRNSSFNEQQEEPKVTQAAQSVLISASQSEKATTDLSPSDSKTKKIEVLAHNISDSIESNIETKKDIIKIVRSDGIRLHLSVNKQLQTKLLEKMKKPEDGSSKAEGVYFRLDSLKYAFNVAVDSSGQAIPDTFKVKAQAGYSLAHHGGGNVTQDDGSEVKGICEYEYTIKLNNEGYDVTEAHISSSRIIEIKPQGVLSKLANIIEGIFGKIFTILDANRRIFDNCIYSRLYGA